MHLYEVTCDIEYYERGMGKSMKVWGPGQTIPFEAASDEEALRIADGMIRGFRWTEWYRDGNGYERNRTAQAYQYSWMRVERIDTETTE